MTGIKARIYAALAGLLAFLGVVGAIYGKGRSDANTARQARDAKDYRNERQKIDDDLRNIGSDDDARRRQLHDIARGRGQGKN